jgi:hypothetical protein
MQHALKLATTGQNPLVGLKDRKVNLIKFDSLLEKLHKLGLRGQLW